MVRVIGFLVGLVFAGVLLISLVGNAASYFKNRPAPLPAEEFHKQPRPLPLASDAPFGKFDKRHLQPGLQVYSEVASACPGLRLVSFGDFKGLGSNVAAIKKIDPNWTP